jgi:hypothetical protein
MKRLGIHASEWAWLGTKFDIILDNNGTIDELYKQAESLVVSDEIALLPVDSILG